MRVNINLDDDFVKQIDASAKKLNISRSAFIAMCCSYCMIAPIGLTDISRKKFIIDGIKSGQFTVADDDNAEF